MKLFRAVIPNLAVSLNVALLIVIYLDMRNPMMGFLVGAPFVTLVVCSFAASVISAVTLYCDYCRLKNRKQVQSVQKNTD